LEVLTFKEIEKVIDILGIREELKNEII